MKLFLKALVYWFASYCIIAGFAWRFVLGMEFPFWKLLVVALVNTIINACWYLTICKEQQERTVNYNSSSSDSFSRENNKGDKSK